MDDKMGGPAILQKEVRRGGGSIRSNMNREGPQSFSLDIELCQHGSYLMGIQNLQMLYYKYICLAYRAAQKTLPPPPPST